MEENFITTAATEVQGHLTALGTAAMPVVLAAVAIGLGFFAVQYITAKGKRAIK